MKIYSLLYLRITYFPPLSASCNCFKHRSIFLSLTCEPYLDDEQGSNRNGKQGCVSNVKTEVESSLVISSLTFSFLDSFTFSTFSLISPLANLRYVYATLNKPRLIEPRFFYRTSKRIELSLATAVQFFVQLPLRLIFISSASSAWQQLLQLASAHLSHRWTNHQRHQLQSYSNGWHSIAFTTHSEGHAKLFAYCVYVMCVRDRVSLHGNI